MPIRKKQDTEVTPKYVEEFDINALPVDADGFCVSESDENVPDSSDELDGEWVTPVEGMEIDGILERAFTVPDSKKRHRPAYGIRDTEQAKDNKDQPMIDELGHPVFAMYLVSERDFFRCFREIKLGERVKLNFNKKVKIGKREKWLGAARFTKKFFNDPSKPAVRAKLYESMRLQIQREEAPF